MFVCIDQTVSRDLVVELYVYVCSSIVQSDRSRLSSYPALQASSTHVAMGVTGTLAASNNSIQLVQCLKSDKLY